MPTVLLRTSPGRRFPASIASTPLLWGLPGPNPGNRSTLRRVRGVVRPRRNGTRIIAQTLALSPGTRLGPYEVTIQIGVGGMGEVYRATDTNLKRSVAIKVLPASVAADAERLARFQREAEVLAALNHSNIAQIYGLEKREGTIALVMELVEGPTIADRIAQGAIPLDEALPIAKQIAHALEAAHERGIIHRDLKPANIKVRADGTVKVLDFGLAKAMEPAAGSSPSTLMAPTITAPAMTHAGMVLGTPAYMSPEQARGKAVDKRADIWAFGCVLYEMLTARSAFAGETTSDTIAKILEREPDWQALPGSTPARIQDLLRRCLHKDQQRRLHDIADARIEIEEARTALSSPRRVVGLPVVAVGVAVALTLLAGTWWYARRSIPSVPHELVSVLIADFQNRTNDPAFDRTLEPLLKLALEGAGFISAYDRSGISGTLGVRPPEKLDEQAAREIAVKQGLDVVLSGSLDHEGNGYGISVKAVQTVTGNVIASAEGRASNKDQVLAAAMKLVTRVRTALGDETSDSAQLFGMQTLSTTSLEVVRHFAAALEASTNNRFDEALRSFSRAVELDPKFGAGYVGMAAISQNLGKPQDAEKYIKEALRYLDGMTERERFNARGMFYMTTGDYQHCVKEYGDLVARYAADVYARNRLAICSTGLRDMRRAVNEMREVVKIVPKRAIFRVNLGLYESYGGDFQAGEREARTAQELGSPLGLLPLAFAQLGREQLAQASETYQALGKADALGTLGTSFSASGLGDLAVYEGRFSDAVQIFGHGAAADLMSKNADRAATKFASLAFAHLLRGENAPAVTAAEKALANSQAVSIRFLAARVLVEAGEIGRARRLAQELATDSQIEPQAHAKIVEGAAFLKSGDPHQAIIILTEANELLNTWIGHFDLGRAYLDAGMFAQSDSEFDRCIKRRGEALSLFVDEEPTYGYLPSVYYYQGRAREGLQTEGFAESYRTYLNIRGKAGEDPLLAEVRRRVDH